VLPEPGPTTSDELIADHRPVFKPVVTFVVGAVILMFVLGALKSIIRP
jgi:hypothetical protein